MQSSELMLKISIENLDETIEKVNQLKELVEEVQTKIDSLSAPKIELT